MANEFRKVTDQNGVDHPVCDDTRVAWADAGKSVKRNEIVFSATSGSKNNVTWTVNEDKSIRVVTGSGGASANTTITLMSNVTDKIGNGETRVISGCPSGGSWQSYCIYIDQTGASADTGNGAIITLNGTGTQFMSIFVANGANIDKTFYPMLTKVGVPTTPYVEPIPDNTELMTWEANGVLGASNIVKIKDGFTTVTDHDVTFTLNDDSSFTVDGTATGDMASCEFADILPIIPSFILTGCPSGGSNSTYRIQIRWYKNGTWTASAYDYGDGYVFTEQNATNYDGFKLAMQVAVNTQVTDMVMKPQISPSKQVPFTPYAMTNRELTKAVQPFDFSVLNLSTTSIASIIANTPINLFKVIAFYNAPTDKPADTSNGFGMAIIIKAAEDLGYARVVYMIGNNYYFGLYDKTNSSITWSKVTTT